MIDAHNHLQDQRLLSQLDEVVDSLRASGITKWMVNGRTEEDWERVADLAERFPNEIVPNFGLHPWFIKNRTEAWEARLHEMLERFPQAGVGEIGIDKWIRDHQIELQEPVFETQLCIAAEQNRPASIHCLRAFGRLKEILSRNPLPESGFLLHSYSGPAELVDEFLELGAYFSISGHFIHERKSAQREVFRQIPIERLFVETDAPDMKLPGDESEFNHPKNLVTIYEFAAGLREMPIEDFKSQISENFRLFSRSKK